VAPHGEAERQNHQQDNKQHPHPQNAPGMSLSLARGPVRPRTSSDASDSVFKGAPLLLAPELNATLEAVPTRSLSPPDDEEKSAHGLARRAWVTDVLRVGATVEQWHAAETFFSCRRCVERVWRAIFEPFEIHSFRHYASPCPYPQYLPPVLIRLVAVYLTSN